MAMAARQTVGQGHGNASGFWYEQGHERRIRASGMFTVMVIDQTVGNFKANTGQSIPAALQLLLLLSIEKCTAGLTGQACQYHVCRPISLLACLHACRLAWLSDKLPFIASIATAAALPLWRLAYQKLPLLCA